MKQKVLLAMAIILETVLLSGALVVYYFSIKRMGMARHLIYYNGQWEDIYPVDLLIMAGLLIVLAEAFLVVVLYFKYRPFKSSLQRILAIESVLFSGLLLYFSSAYGPAGLRAYYVMLALFFLACLVVNGRNLVIMASGRQDALS